MNQQDRIKTCCGKPRIAIELDYMDCNIIYRKGYFCKECHTVIYEEMEALEDEDWQKIADNYPDELG